MGIARLVSDASLPDSYVARSLALSRPIPPCRWNLKETQGRPLQARWLGPCLCVLQHSSIPVLVEAALPCTVPTMDHPSSLRQDGRSAEDDLFGNLTQEGAYVMQGEGVQYSGLPSSQMGPAEFTFGDHSLDTYVRHR